MAKKKTSKKEETVKEVVERVQDAKEFEQSNWTVKINSQLLYKKAVDGRTVLLSMTAEENEKVAEVMSKAIDDLAEILKSRTTQHEAPPKKEQVTRVDTTKSDTVENGDEIDETKTDDVAKSDTVDEAKEEKENAESDDKKWDSDST